MTRIRLTLAALFLVAATASSQVTWTNATSQLVNPNVRSGAPVGIADMNGDGRDDIVRLHRTRDFEVEYQGLGGTWTRTDHGAVGGTQWGMCISDINGDGYPDVFTGGAYNGKKLLTANAGGTSYTQTSLGGPNIFVQATGFADIDDDGDVDLFVCHDDGISSPYRNNGTGTLTYDAGLIVAASTVPSDNSGNYGIIWTDYNWDGDLDLYISKCRLGVTNPMDGRRLNLLFDNDGANNYTDVAQARGIRPMGQSWSADFADIDNDGDLDAFVINHDIASNLYRNDGAGNFTDITTSAGFSASLLSTIGSGIQCKFADFDNDGFIDLLFSGRDNEYRVFNNNGNSTFTATEPFPSPGRAVHSFATGDLNDDGWVDVLACYGSGYNTPSSSVNDRVLLNDANSGNNWVTFRLIGAGSNTSASGARVELYGPWGVQLREVHTGESYGITCSTLMQFGIGAATSITRAEIHWMSGLTCTILSPAINTKHTVNEATCAAGGTVSCTATAPGGTTSGDATVSMNLTSTFGGTVDVGFEYSLDSGASWSPCTAAGSSALTNPAMGVATGAASFTWDTVADGVATTAPETGVLFRSTVTDAGTMVSSSCNTSGFDVDNVAAPSCSLTGPTMVSSGDVPFVFMGSSATGGSIDITFEYSVNGGATWSTCTASATSTLPNPATGIPVGTRSFRWATVTDGVGSMGATSTLVRATVSGGGSLQSSNCTTTAFDVDNNLTICQGLCGDCDLSGSLAILDALQAAQFAVSIGAPNGAQVGCCDIDSDSDIDVLDSLGMAQNAAGITTMLMCP